MLGLLSIYFFQDTTLSQLFKPELWHWQLPYGLALGTGFALITLSASELEGISDVSTNLEEAFKKANLSWIDALYISVCAGVGEELFFRGAMQYFLGIWPTAIIFIAIHGYMSLRNEVMFMYSWVMVFMSACFGYFTYYLGIGSAMIAHAVYDLILLLVMIHSLNKEEVLE